VIKSTAERDGKDRGKDGKRQGDVRGLCGMESHRIHAVIDVMINGELDPRVLNALRQELTGLMFGPDTIRKLDKILHECCVGCTECKVQFMTSKDSDTSAEIAYHSAQIIGSTPLERVDLILRKLLRPAQYERYYESLISEAQKAIWKAREDKDKLAEIREYLWFAVTLLQHVPSWIGTLLLKAAVGLLTRQ